MSGALLFLAPIWLLFLLDRALASSEGYEAAQRYLAMIPTKLAMLLLVWAFAHHFCAGIRYLLLDLHLGIDLPAARRSSVIVLVISLLITLFVGVKLW